MEEVHGCASARGLDRIDGIFNEIDGERAAMDFRVWDIINKRMMKWEKVMDLPAWEIFPGTPEQRAYIVLRSTGKLDSNGQEVFEGDIIENFNGFRMRIRFGTYWAWCPLDERYMDSVGFYAEAPGLPPMPIGSIETYGKVIGNTFESPELMGD